MGPGEELTAEEEEELQYPEDDGQQDTLEQVRTVLDKQQLKTLLVNHVC